MKCRHCGTHLQHQFIDLGSSPPSNAYLKVQDLSLPEKWYPLRVLTCHGCWLVQTEDFAQASDLFDADYAYFSAFSSSWLKHSEQYVNQMVGRFSLGSGSMVVEVAANDGYLLQYVKAAGIPCVGVEPTASTAAAARSKGIEIIEEFFGEQVATEMVSRGQAADLTAANNVLAHVPDINDFVKGFAVLLKSQGVSTFEFPHLLQLVLHNQFDTIYHEHFSYLSLTAVDSIFQKAGLQVFDVEELPTHGGSLRVFAQRSDTGQHPLSDRVQRVLISEKENGLQSEIFFEQFQKQAEKVKDDFLEFLLQAKKSGKKVVAYGAAAKGNTLMNYAGVKSDLIRFVVDKNPA
ncbi:MAG: class I SAM-dependent methyltransferase, partial [Gammaproteobacteria bacterium]